MGANDVGFYFDSQPDQRWQDSPVIVQDDTRYDQDGNLIRVPYQRYADGEHFGQDEITPSITRRSWRA